MTSLQHVTTENSNFGKIQTFLGLKREGKQAISRENLA